MPLSPLSLVSWSPLRFSALALALGAAGPAAAAPSEIEGAWRPQTYVMKDGAERKVDGLIVFTGSTWLTLFFVQSGSDLERGAGEGGSFTLEGDRLTLRHHLHLSAGKALPNVPETSPLRMEVTPDDKAVVEPCRIERAGDRLTIHFPTGNRMHFSRVR